MALLVFLFYSMYVVIQQFLVLHCGSVVCAKVLLVNLILMQHNTCKTVIFSWRLKIQKEQNILMTTVHMVSLEVLS